jgi:hypothetical protein
MHEMDRRTFLVTGGLALAGLATACTKQHPVIPSSATIDQAMKALAHGDGRMQVIQATLEIPVQPRARVPFALLDTAGKHFNGGVIRVYYATATDQPARGPIKAEYHGGGLGDKGVYVARIDLNQAAVFALLAVGQPAGASQELYGQATYMGVDHVKGPAVGAKAISVATPTVDDHRGVEPYCTRTPPCSMHTVSLDVALANGRPTVFNIGTPRFCTSRTCGPVVDVIQTVSAEFASRVNFVHAEVWKNDTDAPANGILAPAPKAWALDADPVTYWIKRGGTITERIVGPTDVAEVRSLTQALVP